MTDATPGAAQKHRESARATAAELMRFVRGAQGMTQDERAWYVNRATPIIAAALSRVEAETKERAARAVCWRCRDAGQPEARHHDDGGYVADGDRVGGWYHDYPDGSYEWCVAHAIRALAPEGVQTPEAKEKP